MGEGRGPYLKLERANKHLSDFQLEVQRFVETKPYRVVAEQHLERPTELAWVVRGTQEVPRHFPAIVSDVIQNLRSALDLAVCAIARSRGESDERIQFPTADTYDGLKKTIAQALQARTGPDVEYIIERDIQPYTGGSGEELRTLHLLSILDKHRLLSPIAYNLALYDITLTHDPRRPIGITDTFRGAVKDGTVLLYTSHYVRFEVGHEVETTFEVTFDKGVPPLTEYQPIASTLLAIAKSVEHVLWLLHAYWGAPN